MGSQLSVKQHPQTERILAFREVKGTDPFVKAVRSRASSRGTSATMDFSSDTQVYRGMRNI